MNIYLQSQSFECLGGVASLFPFELNQNAPAEPAGTHAQIADGIFEVDAAPGLHWLLLQSLRLKRLKDGEEFLIPQHIIPDLTVTSSNVARGTVDVALGRGPVFRVTATKIDGKPVKEVMLVLPRLLDFTLTARFDEKGQLLFFDNPTGYCFMMTSEPYRLLIEPV